MKDQSMEPAIRMRLRWIRLYEKTGNVSLVCRRCGISAPTFRKWKRRYDEHGPEGLLDQSRRPHSSPNMKVDGAWEGRILKMRTTRRIGARRIQSELIRHHDLRLSLSTIHKVLTRASAPPLIRPKRMVATNRYQRAIPGERVQMDTCKIAPGLYQYTAVDDCTRYRVLAVFARRTARNTIEFLDQVTEEMYFPIQRIQTDRGGEFFATAVQHWLMEAGIKFRPVKPRSPHLNGKVERSQRTDKEEFWSCLGKIPNDPESIRHELALWQDYYNWHRPHGSLNGQTPVERICQLADSTPLQGDVWETYTPATERIQEREYHLELKARRLK